VRLLQRRKAGWRKRSWQSLKWSQHVRANWLLPWTCRRIVSVMIRTGHMFVPTVWYSCEDLMPVIPACGDPCDDQHLTRWWQAEVNRSGNLAFGLHGGDKPMTERTTCWRIHSPYVGVIRTRDSSNCFVYTASTFYLTTIACDLPPHVWTVGWVGYVNTMNECTKWQPILAV
jgi:hypothetical protein